MYSAPLGIIYFVSPTCFSPGKIDPHSPSFPPSLSLTSHPDYRMAHSSETYTMSTITTTPTSATEAPASTATAAPAAAAPVKLAQRLAAKAKAPSASPDDPRAAERSERYARYDRLSRQLASLLLTKCVGRQEAHYLIQVVDEWIAAGSPEGGPAIAPDFDPHPESCVSVAASPRSDGRPGFGWTNAFTYRPPGSKDDAAPEEKYWAGFREICPVPHDILDIKDNAKRDAAFLDLIKEHGGHEIVCGHVIEVIPPTKENKGVPIMTFTKGTLPPDGFKGSWDGLKNLRDNGVAPLIDLLARYLAPLGIAVYDQFYGASGNVIEIVWDIDGYAKKIQAIKDKLALRGATPRATPTHRHAAPPPHPSGPRHRDGPPRGGAGAPSGPAHTHASHGKR